MDSNAAPCRTGRREKQRRTENRRGCSQLTLNDGQKDDDDEEEESYVKHYPVDFVVVAVGRFDLVSDTSAGPHALVQVEHETLKHGQVTENRDRDDNDCLHPPAPVRQSRISGRADRPAVILNTREHLPSTCRDIFCPPRRPPPGRRIF